MKKILNIINYIYVPIISILLYILLKPLLVILKNTLSKKNYKNINYLLITIINYIFFYDRIRQKKFNIIKSDIRKYRDTYDTQWLDLYFKILSQKELFENKSILDLWCWIWWKCFEIAKKYKPKNITWIDLSERNIKYAKELINDWNKNILKYEYMDLFNIKDNNIYDTIISFTVFEHIDKYILLKILNKSYEILKNNWNLVIVFNHYNDKFWAHLKEYIYHPWPQSMFDEEILFSYWNKELKDDTIMNENSYFPPDYRHWFDWHNSDCFMNLNKLNIKDFEEIINESKLKYIKRYDYSKSLFLKVFPFLPSKYLEWSVIYNLRK